MEVAERTVYCREVCCGVGEIGEWGNLMNLGTSWQYINWEGGIQGGLFMSWMTKILPGNMKVQGGILSESNADLTRLAASHPSSAVLDTNNVGSLALGRGCSLAVEYM